MKIAKTTYERLGFQDCPKCFPGAIIETTEEEAVAFLEAHPDNAILLAAPQGFIAIWRGARGELDNFYVQELPLEKLSDAEGGNVNALYALTVAQFWAESPLEKSL